MKEQSICKDCIFDGVCRFVFDAYLLANYEYCRHFKPKSRFIELPCAVGDTLYVIDCASIKRPIKERKISDIKISDIGICLYSFGFGYPDYLIGKTVFLAREEAEKALSERAKK